MFFTILSMLISLSFAREGMYSIPVDPSLADFAKFKIDYIKLKQKKKGTLSLQFTLPQDLTGYEERMFFETKKVFINPKFKQADFFGNNGELHCVRQNKQVRCDVRYQNLNINEAQARQFIESVAKTPEEAEARKSVLSKFGGDPVGVLEFRY